MLDATRIAAMHKATLVAAEQAAMEAAKQVAAMDETIRQQFTKKPKKG